MGISAIYLVQPPTYQRKRVKPKGTYPESYSQGEAETGLSPNVFSLLGRSHKGSHTTGLAVLEISGNRETLWLKEGQLNEPPRSF